ncbi:pickpocket protein 19-like isoform X1 [Vespula maculifrons]|uniref:Pickpocket protein 19-like isoform X1 n=1 Tax=Vespula maculifrons TaxID=7453 RepID=A0ABD2D097_VESMC
MEKKRFRARWTVACLRTNVDEFLRQAPMVQECDHPATADFMPINPMLRRKRSLEGYFQVGSAFSVVELRTDMVGEDLSGRNESSVCPKENLRRDGEVGEMLMAPRRLSLPYRETDEGNSGRKDRRGEEEEVHRYSRLFVRAHTLESFTKAREKETKKRAIPLKRETVGIARVFMKYRRGRRQRRKRFESFCQTLQCYCSHTTVHGLKYVSNKELSFLERLFWLFIVVLSSIFAIGTIYMIAEEFQTYPTSSSIESTNYKISGIPFPSVVICPNQHIDWKTAMDLEKKIFSNSTKESSVTTFRELLQKLSIISFGDFDLLMIEILKNSLCSDLLSRCWWRNSYRDCCEIFEVQKTEYGFCYSFNSELSEERRDQTIDKETRPRRTSGYGEWSGVQLTMNLENINKPPNSKEMDGGYVMIQGPRVWPNSGTMTPVGVVLSIALDCISGYATQRVLELDDDRMPCKYDENGLYNQQTCISFCKRAYAVKYCGCNPSFLFPSTTTIRDCDIKDLICLAENNDIFNSYYLLQDKQIVDDKPGMLCDCPPECEYYFYKPRLTVVPISRSKDIVVDIHFETQTSFRYKTDIVLTKLDLLVSFGGIIGLFLGGSLLSAVELIYYLLVLLYCCVSSWYKSAKRKVNVQGESEAVVTVIPRLPILDYGPLKSQSRKIPNLLVYDYAKQKPDRY